MDTPSSLLFLLFISLFVLLRKMKTVGPSTKGVGLDADLAARVAERRETLNKHGNKYAPWSLTHVEHECKLSLLSTTDLYRDVTSGLMDVSSSKSLDYTFCDALSCPSRKIEKECYHCTECGYDIHLGCVLNAGDLNSKSLVLNPAHHPFPSSYPLFLCSNSRSPTTRRTWPTGRAARPARRAAAQALAQ